MKTCIDKVCEGVLCDDECKDLKPSICGKNRELFAPENACGSIRIEGADDVEINQGVCIDLTEGVHAYDGNGQEIEYEVEPSEIGCCDVGVHEVTYTAIGSSKEMIPYFRTSKPMLGFNACGLVVKKVKRLVTILQALPPTIIGAVRTVLPIGASFDPMYGVSGVDDNGNATEVTFEGRYDVATDEDDIVTFDSDVVQDLRSVKVSLEPIQDLNGYDKPWAGGAGKNILKLGDITTTNASSKDKTDNAVTIYNTGTSAGYKYVRYKILDVTALANQTLTFSAKATVLVGTSTPRCLGKLYDSTGTTAIGSALFEITGTSVTSTFTLPSTIAEGTTFCLTLYSDSNHGGEHEIKYYDVQLEEGSTATSFKPYSNICPISGYTEVNAYRTGKNLYQPRFYGGMPYNASIGTTLNPSLYGDVVETDGIYSRQASVWGQCSLYAPIMPNTTYTISAVLTTANLALCQYLLDKEMKIVRILNEGAYSPSSPYNMVRTFTARENEVYLAFYVSSRNGGTISVEHPQLEVGSTATAYEPYQGTTYTTSLGQTVYGGTLDVVSGELKATHVVVDLGDYTWSGTAPNFYITRLTPQYKWSRDNVMYCDKYAFDGYRSSSPWYGENGTIRYYYRAGTPLCELYVRDERFSSIAEMQAGVVGTKLCYELETPQTIQLTPQEVESLIGENNVWSEDGKVQVVYSTPLEDGISQFDFEGVYPIIYHTEDSCGNETEITRYVIVGDNISLEDTYNIACQAKTCYSVIECDENQ